MSEFQYDEKNLSQIPALRTLIKLGYQYVSPKEALVWRGGNHNTVLLEPILRQQLTRINHIESRGKKYAFSEKNIEEAIRKIRTISTEGNEKTYNLLTLGITQKQTIAEYTRDLPLKYIDWKHPTNNVFHVVPEYSVACTHSSNHETKRPDIVLFVNGIPIVVIECKAPSVTVKEGISQIIGYQGRTDIPRLFAYVQLVMATNKNTTYYGTTGTPEKFWSIWHEREDNKETIDALVNTPLTAEQNATLFAGIFAPYKNAYADRGGHLIPTEQDHTLYSMCRPERLLDLAYNFIVFDKHVKKIARYQQFFVVRSTIQRITQRDEDHNRKGGVIWHTQGSGKSLTMVMLTRALTRNVMNPRIILVTDRILLHEQLKETFQKVGEKPETPNSGRQLIQALKDKKSIITTTIHKFDRALAHKDFTDSSQDIFVLVDESHRTNVGSLAASMRQMLPNACYIGFTGTPILKKEKSTVDKFGGLIEPHYSIKQAVRDKAVVPLLYEGRHVDIHQNQSEIDKGFDRYTEDLTESQKSDLKRKYARASELNKADKIVYRRALDISEHFRKFKKNTGLKGQLVAPDKATAIKYHTYLQEIGQVTSAVIISPPDVRKGHTQVDVQPENNVLVFWNNMMKQYPSEEEYNTTIIKDFNKEANPEILIVVDKLLTGFDAPVNTVLYLCRTLREHTLLQAIARVNRLHKNKDFGYIIDYIDLFGELNKSLTMYEQFEGYDEQDIAETFTSIRSEIDKLPHLHSVLLGTFRGVKNKQDEEAMEVWLRDAKRREEFYTRLSKYSKVLGIALSTNIFYKENDREKIKQYKADLRKFYALKFAVKLRYAESIDYRDYEPNIKKLLHTYIQADQAVQTYEPVDLFDEESNFTEFKEGQGIYASKTDAQKADSLSNAMKKRIKVKKWEDPAFYNQFSALIQQVINDFNAQRILGEEYLQRMVDIRDKLVFKQRDNVPEPLQGKDEALAFYGVILPYFQSDSTAESGGGTGGTGGNGGTETGGTETVGGNGAPQGGGNGGTGNGGTGAVRTALEIQHILHEEKKVNFWEDIDAQKEVEGRIEDFLYDDIGKKQGILLHDAQIKAIIEKTMNIAKNRRYL